MAKRCFSMTGLAVVVLIVLAACGTPTDDTGMEPTVTRIASPANAPVITATSKPGEPTVAPTTAAGSPEAGGDEGAASGEQEVTVTAHDIYFDPAEIKVKAGKVKFVLPNEGAAEHDFSIDELNVQVNMPAGTTQTVEVDLPAGTYQYYCNIPGHKDAGMVGTLVVE
jgi:nitrite reductase (NO-forming)